MAQYGWCSFTHHGAAIVRDWNQSGCTWLKLSLARILKWGGSTSPNGQPWPVSLRLTPRPPSSCKSRPHFVYLHQNKFLQSLRPDYEHTYIGERSKKAIVDYALRMAGPPVQEIKKADSVENLKKQNQLFFVYVGKRKGWYHKT